MSARGGHAYGGARLALDHDAEHELEQWAASLPPRQPVDPTRRPDRTSRAELAHRDALALAKYAPQTRCGVCVTCRYGGSCERYG